VRDYTFRLAAVITGTNGKVLHRHSYDRCRPVPCQGTERVLASKKMATKECPMCGEHMRLTTREQTDRIPGSRDTKTKRVSEWVCPECDYFEEADDES
jgi:YgiT-type zinc finger domain-containing protein